MCRFWCDFLCAVVNVCVLLSVQCELDADSGSQCADYVQCWFFDKAIGACSPFWYGGCGGNANRFNTEHECFQTCRGRCNLCYNKFNKKCKCKFNKSECSRFWYGGCGGNGNRFPTQEECEHLCLKPPRTVKSSLTCEDAGGCQNYTMMWYFDTVQSECSRFWYGGCGGNGNRFPTQEECEHLCVTKTLTKTSSRISSIYFLLNESRRKTTFSL
uniref:BPTI/Kunitz inhibitor domain-containing protein n=1 Tax=Myripristis murdjan TaxID=586833 RepID=A0A667YVT6_9TELE